MKTATIKIKLLETKVDDFKSIMREFVKKTAKTELMNNPDACHRVMNDLLQCFPESEEDYDPREALKNYDHANRPEEIIQFIKENDIKILYEEALYNAITSYMPLVFIAFDISTSQKLNNTIRDFHEPIKECLDPDSEYEVNAVVGYIYYKYKLIDFDYEPITEDFAVYIKGVMRNSKKNK